MKSSMKTWKHRRFIGFCDLTKFQVIISTYDNMCTLYSDAYRNSHRKKQLTGGNEAGGA